MASPSTARSALTPLAGEPARRIPPDAWMLAGIAIAVLTTIAGIASTGVNLRYFLQPTAAWIVLGGTLGVTLVTTPRNSLLSRSSPRGGTRPAAVTNREELKDEIVSFVRTARIQGLLAMEPRIKQASNGFLREMLALAMDVKSRSEFQSTLETKLRLRERQGDADAKVLEVAGGFAPAIGVIGTVVGLIDVLRQFSNMGSVAARHRYRFCLHHVWTGAGKPDSSSSGAPDSGQRRGNVRDRRDDRRRRARSDGQHSSVVSPRTSELLPAPGTRP